MAQFCDVALPVPVNSLFTYRVSEGMEPLVGGRVLVPFRQQRLPGVVLSLHDCVPTVKAKDLLQVLDSEPLLDEQLLKLGKWMSDYYLAPLGEVFRTMLPLGAEFKRSIVYHITDQGLAALHLAGMSGSSARSRSTPQDQLTEFRVLDYLAVRENVKAETLRNATGASQSVLANMVRKHWIAREDVSGTRVGARMIKVAVLKNTEGKL